MASSTARTGFGLIGQFQRNEYTRYQRELRRRRGRVFVLTGTASVFRPRALRAVAEERGTTLPGVPGDVYDTVALTEDNELTIALKSLGALMISPSDCTVVTEVMPTWRALWAQRLRWQRGALENLGAYGLRPQTFRYWAQQLGIGYGVIALAAYLLLIAADDAGHSTAGSGSRSGSASGWSSPSSGSSPCGAAAGGRGCSACRLFPELFYAMFLNVVYVKGIWDLSLARRRPGSTSSRPTPASGSRTEVPT